MEGRAIDRRADLGGGLEPETGDHVDVEALDLALDVGVFGVLLVALRQGGVADLEPVFLERFAIELRRKADEDVDVAVAADPGVAGSRADL